MLSTQTVPHNTTHIPNKLVQTPYLNLDSSSPALHTHNFFCVYKRAEYTPINTAYMGTIKFTHVYILYAYTLFSDRHIHKYTYMHSLHWRFIVYKSGFLMSKYLAFIRTFSRFNPFTLHLPPSFRYDRSLYHTWSYF